MVALGGVVAVGLLLAGGFVSFLGLMMIFVLTIVLGIVLQQLSVIGERNKGNLPFVMSLPISPIEYAMAKILANVSMFMLLWLILMGSLLFLLLDIGLKGLVPPIVVLGVAPLIGFCVMLGVAVCISSDALWTWTMALVNVAYGLLWLQMTRIPGIREQAFGPSAVWSPGIITLLIGDLVVLALAVGLTLFAQSRKKSFL
jgi:hypothetical protein